jgi:hypothetical protein
LAGTPTAIEFGGTSVMTTALAPMATSSPMLDAAQHLGSGADVDAVADDRRATLAGVAQADGDAVANDAVVAEDGVAADDDAAEVIDPESGGPVWLRRGDRCR